MSGETKCPFEVGQWVTDGSLFGVVSGRSIAVVRPSARVWRRAISGKDQNKDDWTVGFLDPDWSTWIAFEPSLAVESEGQRKDAVVGVRHVAIVLSREDAERHASDPRSDVHEECKRALEVEDGACQSDRS